MPRVSGLRCNPDAARQRKTLRTCHCLTSVSVFGLVRIEWVADATFRCSRWLDTSYRATHADNLCSVSRSSERQGREKLCSRKSRYVFGRRNGGLRHGLTTPDSYLNDILKQLDTYTVIYYTTPVSAEQYQEIQHPDEVYEMDSPFPSGMHGDLKRDVGGYASSNNTNTGNLYSDVPLFEKYQFVNQGKSVRRS